MHPKRYKARRMIIVVAAVASIALGFIGFSIIFRDNLIFFFTPAQLYAQDLKTGKTVRMGGLVMQGTFKETAGTYTFDVTDGTKTITTRYTGMLPALFKEGQGVVAEGTFDGKLFQAKTILAKHDENYMPPEVATELKKSGHWKDSYKQ